MEVPEKSSKYTEETHAPSALASLNVSSSIASRAFQPGDEIIIDAPLGSNLSASKTAIEGLNGNGNADEEDSNDFEELELVVARRRASAQATSFYTIVFQHF